MCIQDKPNVLHDGDWRSVFCSPQPNERHPSRPRKKVKLRACQQSQQRYSDRKPSHASAASLATWCHAHLHPTGGAAPRTCPSWGRVRIRTIHSIPTNKYHLQIGFGSRYERGKLPVVLAANLLDGEDGSSLLVNNRAEAGLALDDHIWNTHLPAERGKEHNQFNRVNVVSDDDERRFLRLDESYTVVQAVLREDGLLGVLWGR